MVSGHGIDYLAAALEDAIGVKAVQTSEPLARHTALRVGGPADLLVTARSAEVLRRSVVLAWEYEIPCRVLGGGSNILVSDQGVRGMVILNRARATEFTPGMVRAESGTYFSTLAQRCIMGGQGGLEWAVGIPGTVGGAVVGNAGAWGSDISSTLIQATVLEKNGRSNVWPVAQFGYGYRTSTLKEQVAEYGHRAVVLDAEFALIPAEAAALRKRANTITARRKESQPPGATCGSVFKNPADDYAGRLIDQAGLKGRRCGGAQISPLHANFVVNLGQATAADIKSLIDLVQAEVLDQFGLALETEIEFIGEW